MTQALITGHANQQTQPLAMEALDAFNQSTMSGVWPHLDKNRIIDEMRQRLKNPFTVNQGQQPFCGPASIVFELIQKQPLRYVEMCRDLYEKGQFQVSPKTIKASEHLRQASQGDLRTGPADWMLLATLRESENLLFPVDPNAPTMVRNIAGMTKSWEMKGWVQQILGYANVDYHHTYVWRDIRALKRSQKIIANGGVAFALITANGLLDDEPLTVTVPNHWVTIVGNINIKKGWFWRHDSGHVSFDVFTWARKMPVRVPEGRFEDSFWGVVLGWN